MKTMELIRKVGEVLHVTDDNRQNKTVVKSNFVDIVIYREKSEDLSGKNISESGASVVIPDSKDVFPNANESVTIQVRRLYFIVLWVTLKKILFHSGKEISVTVNAFEKFGPNHRQTFSFSIIGMKMEVITSSSSC